MASKKISKERVGFERERRGFIREGKNAQKAWWKERSKRFGEGGREYRVDVFREGKDLCKTQGGKNSVAVL